jgi:undecaprenyl-diphosphatase
MSKSAQLSQSSRRIPLVLSDRALLAALICSAAVLWGAFRVDQGVLDFVTHHSGGFSRWLARGVSLVGDWYGVAALGLLGWWRARRRNSGHWKKLWLVMGICGALGGLSANVIRTLSGRARPHGGAPAGWYGPSEARHPIKSAYAFQSFPSAHTSVVAGFCAPLGWVALRSRNRRWLFIGVGLSLSGTLLMAWSRVWVGAHHLSDVLAAALLGWGIALAWVRYRAPELIQSLEKAHGASPS